MRVGKGGNKIEKKSKKEREEKKKKNVEIVRGLPSYGGGQWVAIYPARLREEPNIHDIYRTI